MGNGKLLLGVRSQESGGQNIDENSSPSPRLPCFPCFPITSTHNQAKLAPIGGDGVWDYRGDLASVKLLDEQRINKLNY